MKKVLFTIAAAVMMFAATSCKKENVNEPENFNREPEAYEFLATVNGGATTQNAPRVNDGMGTMATFDPETLTQVMWQVGDTIKVNGIPFTCTTNPGKGEGQVNRAYFENDNYKTSGYHADEYHAFYSTSVSNTSGNGGTLNAIQYYNPENQAENLPMYATSTDHWLNFSNICAAIKIYVPCTADHIVIKNTSAAMNGAFDVQSNVAVMNVPQPNDGNKKITIYKGTQGHTTAFNACDSLFIAIPAGTYEGFEIAFLNQSGDTIYTTGAGGTLNVSANHIYRIVGYKYPNHLLPGKFKVSNNEYVQFTTGNLWRKGSEGSYEYHFEDNQNGYPITYDVNHVGHFNDLVTPMFGDTLYDAWTHDEFTYLLGLTYQDDRKWYCSRSKVSFAQVDDVWCLLVAPDGATAFNPNRHNYTLKEVNSMGLLCLPFAGNLANVPEKGGMIVVFDSRYAANNDNIMAKYWAKDFYHDEFVTTDILRYIPSVTNFTPYKTNGPEDIINPMEAVNLTTSQVGRPIRLLYRPTQTTQTTQE